MMRTERPLLSALDRPHSSGEAEGHQLLLAVAPPPRSDIPTLSEWPRWLAPAYLAGRATSRTHLRHADSMRSNSTHG